MNLTIAARRLLLTSPLFVSTNVAAFSNRSSRRLPSAVFGGRVDRVMMTRAFTSSTASHHMANVLRLSDPQSELLDEVDVFIFDCDGVIWRVRNNFQEYCTMSNGCDLSMICTFARIIYFLLFLFDQ